MSEPPADNERSLRDELRKRRTQAAQQAAQQARTPPSQPPTTPASTPAAPPAPSRSTQTVRPTTAKPSNAASSTSAGGVKRQPIIIALVAMLVVVVGLIGALLLTGGNPPATPAPTAITLPLISARDVLAYLIRAGVPISNVRDVIVPSEVWGAVEGVQFDVQIGADRGTFIILSYASVDDAGADAFRVELEGEYSDWTAYTISNILVLSTPETPQRLDIEINSHVTTYIAGGLVLFLPTSTGAFAGAAVTDSAATAVAVAASQTAGQPFIPTAPSILVTLTPRPPTETRTPTLTLTLRPTRTNTRPVTASPTRTGRPRQTVTVRSTTDVTSGTTATAAPYELIPTADKSRAERFVAAVPRFLEPLRLESTSIITDAAGAFLYYITSEGVQYEVVLFITNDREEARYRYDLDKSLSNGWQNLSGLGDESVIYAPGNIFLAELVYQDMVLIVYNPAMTNTVPPRLLSQDDLLRLLQRLYIVLPVQN